MSYATRADMTARFGEEDLVRLTDREAALDAIDDAVLAAAIVDADSLIDAHLASRYDLPLATVPRVLTTLSCDIAWFYLQRGAPSEAAQRAYDDAVRLLAAIAAGRVSVGPDANGQTPAGDGGVLVSCEPPVWSRATLGDY